MELAQALLLGTLQGLTEFLPVSSSGHLVVLQSLFGIKEPQLLLDVVLHMGTLSAVVLYLRKDIVEMLSPYALKDIGVLKRWGNVIVALIPTGTIGLWIENKADVIFCSPFFVGLMLLATGLILILPRFFRFMWASHIGWQQALFIGIAQGLAVLPGISRSGITITTALLLGIKGEEAGRFSFLISCPAIMGALLLQLMKDGGTGFPFGIYAAGFLSSFIVGYVSLSLLLWIIKKGASGNLHWFSPYCFFLGLLLLWFTR